MAQKITIDWEISISNVITLVTLGVIAIAGFVRLETAVRQVEQDIDSKSERLTHLERSSISEREFEQFQMKLNNIEEQLMQVRISLFNLKEDVE